MLLNVGTSGWILCSGASGACSTTPGRRRLRRCPAGLRDWSPGDAGCAGASVGKGGTRGGRAEASGCG
jgi:hypothetical protein